MSDLKLRELERRFRATRDPGDEVAYLRERLAQGDLAPAQLALAAHLGHRPAQIALGPTTQDSCGPGVVGWIWRLCDWGAEVQALAATTLAERALSNCSLPAEPWLLEALPLSEAKTALAIPWGARSPSADKAAAHAREALSLGIERAERALEEASGSGQDHDRLLSALEACLAAAQSVTWRPLEERSRRAAELRAEAGPAIESSTAMLAAISSLGRDLAQALLRSVLLPRALSETGFATRQVPASAKLLLADFESRRSYSPEGVLRVDGEDWEYLPIHAFADEASEEPGLSPAVDAYCRFGEEVVFLQVVAFSRPRAAKAYGFRSRWEHSDPPRRTLTFCLDAPKITRQSFEECMAECFAAMGKPGTFQDE